MDECEAAKMAGEVVHTLATQAGRGMVKEALRNVVDFLKRKLGKDVADKVDGVVQGGADSGAAESLEGSIRDALLGSPDLVSELRQLLEAASPQYAAQQAKVEGGGSVVQIQGDRNKIG